MFADTDIEMIYVSPEGPVEDALKKKEIPYHLIPCLNVKQVQKAIDIVKPDVIHAHDMRASVTAALATSLPIISHIHNNNYDSRKISAKSLIYYICSRKFSHIFWVSESACNDYRFSSQLKGKSSVLYNVIDDKKIMELASKGSGNSADVYDAVYVGRLTYQKNPQRLVHIISEMKKRKPDVRVAVVGTGDLKEEVESLVHTMGLDDNIALLGFQGNPYPFMKNSKAMLMSSRWEGTPMCVLEALALGIPVVSTPTDGIADIVHSGVNGYLSDSDDVLAQKAIDIISQNDVFQVFSENARQAFEQINDLGSYRKKLLKEYCDATCTNS